MNNVYSVMPVVIMGIFLVVILALVAGMALYVSKDAKVHDMNPFLWVLVVVFVPNFLGLVIYLIVRSSALKKSACYECGKLVENDYAICPFCKTELTQHCRSCDKVLSPEWRSCPHCGQEVDAEQVTRVVKKDKSLKAIILLIIVVVAVPIILVVMLIIFGRVAYNSVSSETSTQMMAVENNFGRNFQFNAMRFNGEKTDNLNVKKDGTIQIDSSVNYEKGVLSVILYNDQNAVIYEFENNGEDTYQMNVKKGEHYIIKVDGKIVENIKVHFSWDYINE